MDFLCFKTTDAAAFNATKLYDDNSDSGDLWSRQTELPPCSPTLSPPQFLCLVCHQIIIYAVCSNLTNGVKIVMEGVGLHIQTLKSECPKPKVSGHLHGTNILAVGIIIPFIIIIIIISLALCLRWRRRNTQQQQRNREHQTYQTEPLTQVQVQNGGANMS